MKTDRELLADLIHLVEVAKAAGVESSYIGLDDCRNISDLVHRYIKNGTYWLEQIASGKHPGGYESGEICKIMRKGE